MVNSKSGASMPHYGATKVAAESLIITQINSQCKLATLKRKNLNIRHEHKI
jgi:hypothetical protein